MLDSIHKSTFAILVLVATAAADAQHLDVLAYNDDGKIGVGEFNFETLTAQEKRVFPARLDQFYSVNNPGFTSQSGPDALPANSELEWDFLPMAVDTGPHVGWVSNLLYWDGSGAEPQFGPTPTDEYEFSLYGEDAPGVADGGDQVVTGNVIGQTDPSGSLHIHRYYFLDDNGDGLNTTLPDAGIYLLAMRLRIAGLQHSDPFFFVWATPELSVLPAIQPAAAWVRERVNTLAVEGLPGDFNGDGSVDAADYTVWRDDQGDTYPPSAYYLWATHYGAQQSSSSRSAEVPEPCNFVCGVLLLIGFDTQPRFLRSRVRDSRTPNLTWRSFS